MVRREGPTARTHEQRTSPSIQPIHLSSHVNHTDPSTARTCVCHPEAGLQVLQVLEGVLRADRVDLLPVRHTLVVTWNIRRHHQFPQHDHCTHTRAATASSSTRTYARMRPVTAAPPTHLYSLLRPSKMKVNRSENTSRTCDHGRRAMVCIMCDATRYVM